MLVAAKINFEVCNLQNDTIFYQISGDRGGWKCPGFFRNIEKKNLILFAHPEFRCFRIINNPYFISEKLQNIDVTFTDLCLIMIENCRRK